MNKSILTLLLLLSWNLILCQDDYEFSVEIEYERTKVKVPSKSINLNLSQLIKIPNGDPNGAKLTIIADHDSKKNSDKFSSLDIGYEIVGENGFGYKGELNLNQESEIDGNQLFSLYPYRIGMDRFIGEDVFLNILYLKLDGQLVQELPDKTKLKLEINASPPEKEFDKISKHLITNNIYPNRASFNLLFTHNPNLFNKRKFLLSKITTANLKPLQPTPDNIEKDERIIRRIHIKDEKLNRVSTEWNTTMKKIKKRHLRDKNKIKQIKYVKKFLEDLNNGKTSISEQTLELLLDNCTLAMWTLNQTSTSKKKMPVNHWNAFNALLKDIEIINEVLQEEKIGFSYHHKDKSRSGSLTSVSPNFEKLTKLKTNSTSNVFVDGESDGFLLIVSTYDDLPPLLEEPVEKVKAIPNAHIKMMNILGEAGYQSMTGDRYPKEFITNSSAHSFRYLSPCMWHLWAENPENILDFENPTLELRPLNKGKHKPFPITVLDYNAGWGYFHGVLKSNK